MRSEIGASSKSSSSQQRGHLRRCCCSGCPWHWPTPASTQGPPRRGSASRTAATQSTGLAASRPVGTALCLDFANPELERFFRTSNFSNFSNFCSNFLTFYVLTSVLTSRSVGILNSGKIGRIPVNFRQNLAKI